MSATVVEPLRRSLHDFYRRDVAEASGDCGPAVVGGNWTREQTALTYTPPRSDDTWVALAARLLACEGSRAPGLPCLFAKQGACTPALLGARSRARTHANGSLQPPSLSPRARQARSLADKPLLAVQREAVASDEMLVGAANEVSAGVAHHQFCRILTAVRQPDGMAAPLGSSGPTARATTAALLLGVAHGSLVARKGWPALFLRCDVPRRVTRTDSTV